MRKFSEKGNKIFSEHAAISSASKVLNYSVIYGLAATQIQMNPSKWHDGVLERHAARCGLQSRRWPRSKVQWELHAQTHTHTHSMWSKVRIQHIQKTHKSASQAQTCIHTFRGESGPADLSSGMMCSSVSPDQNTYNDLRASAWWQQNQRKTNRVLDEAREGPERSEPAAGIPFWPSVCPSSCLPLFFCLSAELKATAQWVHVLTFHNTFHFCCDPASFLPD